MKTTGSQNVMTTIGSRKESQTTQQNHKQKCESHLNVRGSIKDQRCVPVHHMLPHLSCISSQSREGCSAGQGCSWQPLRCFRQTPHSQMSLHIQHFHSGTAPVFMSQHVHKQQAMCSTGQVRHLQLRCLCMPNCIFVLEFIYLSPQA